MHRPPFGLVARLASTLLSGLGFGATLAGCAAPCAPHDRCVVGLAPAASAPRDRWAAAARVHGRGHAAVWSFLAATYDLDRDGRITPAEHPRGEAVVGRLDRDGDAALTAADFAGPTVMANYLVALVFERIAADPPRPDPASASGGGRRGRGSGRDDRGGR